MVPPTRSNSIQWQHHTVRACEGESSGRRTRSHSISLPEFGHLLVRDSLPDGMAQRFNTHQ
jgi:hypothetical protein